MDKSTLTAPTYRSWIQPSQNMCAYIDGSKCLHPLATAHPSLESACTATDHEGLLDTLSSMQWCLMDTDSSFISYDNVTSQVPVKPRWPRNNSEALKGKKMSTYLIFDLFYVNI